MTKRGEPLKPHRLKYGKTEDGFWWRCSCASHKEGYPTADAARKFAEHHARTAPR